MHWTRRPAGFLALSLSGYLALFAISIRHSLASLLAGHVPPDLGYGQGTRTSLQLLQVGCVLYLFVLYANVLKGWAGARFSAGAVARVALALTAAAVILLPANSSDLLEYLGFGRLFAIYRLNPYTHTYGEITDWFSSLVTWDDPMPYGPGVLPLFSIAGLLTQVHLLAGIYALKLAWAALHLANSWLTYLVAVSLVDDALLAAFAVACNPLVLLEQVGNGHNDGLLVLCSVGALLAVQRRREGTALVVASAGAALKVAGIVPFAGVMALLVRQRRWRPLALGLAGAAACALAVAAWPGAVAALTVLNSQWHFSEDSLHTLAISGLLELSTHVGAGLEYDAIFRADRVAASLVFVAFAGWRFTRVADLRTLVREVGHVFLALLLGYAVAVQPWYFSWIVPIAALSDGAWLRRATLLSCVTALALYAFPYWLVEEAPWHPLWASIRLIVAFGVPVGYIASHLWVTGAETVLDTTGASA